MNELGSGTWQGHSVIAVYPQERMKVGSECARLNPQSPWAGKAVSLAVSGEQESSSSDQAGAETAAWLQWSAGPMDRGVSGGRR